MFGAPTITGPWRFIGDSLFPAGECPSLFALPPLTHAADDKEALPTHVYKRGADRADVYTLGNFKDGVNISDVGSWSQTAGVVFTERRIDRGNVLQIAT